MKKLRDKLAEKEGAPYYETKEARVLAFKNGWDAHKEQVLKILNENYTACKTLTDEDKVRTAQEIVNETYEDLIAIFS